MFTNLMRSELSRLRYRRRAWGSVILVILAGVFIPASWADQIRHAGALFLGPYASESLGDYCAGPNHVLPTMRTARFSSPLGVYDFQKRSSMIEVSRAGAQVLGRVASTLAHGEGLQAHARSAELRLDP